MAARYDGIAEWFDERIASSDLALTAQQAALNLLGTGPGRLLDIGCGGGRQLSTFADAGWTATGVDESEDQLRLARERGCNVVRGDAMALPFASSSFDSAVSIFTHTDVGDFGAVLREAHRVLRDGGRLVYVGAHPCFVGPHSEDAGTAAPLLHPGYRDTTRRYTAPGISDEGLRARVGARHLPLGLFLQAFLKTGLVLERVEEPENTELPKLLAIAARR
jgi:ubiquinone/menaquinone biosynthesis C-methylase UbiE